MAVTWFTEIPQDAPKLPEEFDDKTTWQLAVAESNGRVGLSIQSSDMDVARVVNITSQLDELIEGLQAARRRIGRDSCA